MSTTTSFENYFEQYSPSVAVSVFSEKEETVSEAFEKKLRGFLSTKLKLLRTTMEKDIFCNGSVYTGSSGLALYYLLDCLKSNTHFDSLKQTLQFINLNELRGHKISFLCGDAGPLAIATVVSYKMGAKKPDSLPDYKVLVQRLTNLSAFIDDSPSEILYGKAGYLYALLFVNKFVNGKEIIPSNLIEKIVGAILNSGKQFSTQMQAESPLMWQWHNKVYLGAAHGMAGILYMLLQARKYVKDVEMQSLVKPSIDWLINQQFPSGNFPSSLNSSSGDRLVQWCHGSPGFVPLCLLAYQVFEDEKFLKIAVKCGDLVWDRGLCTKGYSLCHGVGGNAYTFIQLYQITKEPVHAYRACCFAEWCALERPGSELHPPDRPASLYEGLLGRIYLLKDMLNITQAKFPGYTL